MLYSQVSQDARLVFVGILLFVIAYQLWVARVRRSEPVLYSLAAWAAGVGCGRWAIYSARNA